MCDERKRWETKVGSELFVMTRNDFTVPAKMTKLITGGENMPNQVSVLTLLGSYICQSQRSVSPRDLSDGDRKTVISPTTICMILGLLL